jgi:hypothetical protein
VLDPTDGRRGTPDQSTDLALRHPGGDPCDPQLTARLDELPSQ